MQEARLEWERLPYFRDRNVETRPERERLSYYRDRKSETLAGTAAIKQPP